MPYSTMKTVPAGMKSVALTTGGKAISLTLAQVNELAAIHDEVKGDPKIDEPMAVAKAAFRKSHQVKDGKWVKKKAEEADEKEEHLEARGAGTAPLGTGGTDTCECPECGYETKHERGTACNTMECPECGAKLAGKNMPQSARKEGGDVKKKKEEGEGKESKLETYLDVNFDGGMRKELDVLQKQLREASRASGQFGETAEEWDLDLMEIVGTQVYIYNTKISKYYRADYKVEQVDGTNTVTFSNVIEVIMKVIPIPLSKEGKEGATKTVFEEAPKEGANAKPPEPGSFVMEEKVFSEAGKTKYVLSGKVFLEESGNDGTSGVFKASGTVPMIEEGALTTNKNRYMKECVDWLETDIARLLESKTSGDVLDMYPTHAPVTKPEANNPLLNKSGKITGLSRDGDVASIGFETIATNAGQDMAVLLEQGMVSGVSLRAFPTKVVANEEGGDDVYRMRLFGADFTDNGAMQFDDEGKAGFQLEEEGEGEQMTIKEVKANAELMATLQEEFRAAQDGSDAQKEIELKLEAGKKAQEELQKIEREGEKATLLESAAEVLKKEELLTESRQKRILAQIGVRMEQIVATEDPKKLLEEIVAKEIEAEKLIIAEERKNDTRKKFGSQVSDLDHNDRRLGLLAEETGGSHKVSDILAAKVLQQPVFRDGVSIFEEYAWLLDPIMENQRKYMAGGGDGIKMESQEAMARYGAIGSMLLEAGEQTVATTIPGGLPTEVAEAIIKTALPALIATKICRTGVMKSKTKTFWERTYQRYADRTWGTMDHAGSFTGSGAAITYAQPAQVKVTEVVDAATTFIITGLDQNGNTMTGSAVVATTDAIGVYVDITPTNVGDRWTDISAVTASGWDTSGSGTGGVSFITEEPITGSEASAYPKARTTLTEVVATASSHELGAALSNDTIEDMRLAMKDQGGGYDVMADLVALLAQDIEEFIDTKIFIDVASGATGATDSFVQSTVPAGYTATEWNATVERSINDCVGKIEYASNVGPNWMAINTMDRGRFVDWLGARLFKYNVARDDAFQRARAIGNVGGCEVYVSTNAPRSKWLFGSNQIGLHYLIYIAMQLLGPQWDPTSNTQAILRRQRSAIKVTQPNTLGSLTIT